MKICTIIGARPQFIKASAVSREIAKRQSQGHSISEVIVHTGQHFDSNMSDIFFEEMAIPEPNYHLSIQESSHAKMTGKMLYGIEEVLIKEKPDYLLTYGDTNSTLAGALAASKLHIPVVHVEAGLRSFNINMPEEQNRILTDRLSSFLFCPTTTAEYNLKKEGANAWRPKPSLSIVGDVMLDSAMYYKDFSKKPQGININKDFVLCTVHRAENTDNVENLKSIFLALKEISHTHSVVLPLHPRTAQKLNHYNIDVSSLNIIDPVGYLEMVWLIEHSKVIMTDSGGLQKDAYFFCKPCITLREETEWVELVDNGFNKLVGNNFDNIISTFNANDLKISYDISLYGKGDASKLIIDRLLSHG